MSPDSFPTRKLKYLLQAVMEDIRTTDEIIQGPSPLHGIIHYPPGFTFKVGVLPTLRPGSFEIPWPELLSGGAWQGFPRSPREGAQHQKHNRDFQGGQSLDILLLVCPSQLQYHLLYCKVFGLEKQKGQLLASIPPLSLSNFWFWDSFSRMSVS